MDGNDQISRKVQLSDNNIINSFKSSVSAANFQKGYQSISWDHLEITAPYARTKASRETILKQGISCAE